jgi:hypothetical protein
MYSWEDAKLFWCPVACPIMGLMVSESLIHSSLLWFSSALWCAMGKCFSSWLCDLLSHLDWPGDRVFWFIPLGSFNFQILSRVVQFWCSFSLPARTIPVSDLDHFWSFFDFLTSRIWSCEGPGLVSHICSNCWALFQHFDEGSDQFVCHFFSKTRIIFHLCFCQVSWGIHSSNMYCSGSDPSANSGTGACDDLSRCLLDLCLVLVL